MADGKLAGRTALVTGGSSGIGLAVANRFIAEGAAVVIAGRRPDRLDHAVRQLAAGPRLHAFTCDVSDPDQVEDLIRFATGELQRIDILVNNAGVNLKQRAMRELTVDGWQRVLRINLDGAFYCTRAVLPQMRERGDGLIINISSIAGKRAGPLSGAAYAASKFGMSALAHCVDAEEKDRGIRCCTVYPGEVDTPILDDRPNPVTPEHRQRILRPEDVADAVLFIAALPKHVTIPELVIKPASQAYV